MCDCYAHTCNHKNCTTKIPIHLGDYETGREEIAVFCGSHIPKDRIYGALFKWRHGKSSTRVFIEYLSLNAKQHWEGNHVNDDRELIEVWGNKP